ncbi:hypothetical protein, variant 3 [Aphanomyces astaci]|nr:hypothetical protein, variant 3 [Aphanomyces astaci]ETV72881.1 hypothetical protein, variant 3 [Aphanomyces astaci]|eukprot:XP_009837670.1 hypothetical protein, variant 3 [Aphanomyces astaci]
MPRMRGTVILLAAAAVYGLYGHYVGVHAGDTDGTCDATGGSTSCGMPSVLERGLLQRTPSYDSILQEEKQYGSDVLTKRFHGDTLGYVTPWNNHGYNTAKLFRSKFTYIAPVWYQIRHNDKRKPALTGGHDVDLEWMTAVRGDDTSGPQIVPRFMFEMNSLSPQEAERIISLIRSEVKDQRFDGITLEIPVLGVTVEFITSLGQALQSDGCILILVLPTSQRNGQLTTSTDLIAKYGLNHVQMLGFHPSCFAKGAPVCASVVCERIRLLDHWPKLSAAMAESDARSVEAIPKQRQVSHGVGFLWLRHQ